MNHPKQPLWTKEFLLSSSINFFLAFVYYLLMVTISLYAMNEFHATTSEAGLVSGIFIIGVVGGRLLTGRMIDRVGCRKLLVIGLVSFLIITFLYFGIRSLAVLIAIRLFHGIALGIASTAAATIAGLAIPQARRGEGFGYYSMSVLLSLAIGPFIGLHVNQLGRFQAIFALCLIVSVISVAAAFFINVPKKGSGKATASSVEKKGFKISNFLELSTIPIAVVTLAAGFSYSCILPFIGLYTKEIELWDATSMFFMVYAIVTLLSRPFTGRLFDRKGSNMIVYPALLIFAVGMLLLSQAYSEFTLLLAGAFIGLGFGNFQSNAQAISVKLSPPNRIGLATSTYFIFIETGIGIGPYLLGFIIPLIGYRALYLTMGMCVFGTMILYYFLHGKKESGARRSGPQQLKQIQ